MRSNRRPTLETPPREPPPLLRVLIDMADTLADDYDAAARLDYLAAACATLFSTSAAALMLAGRNGLLTAAAASDAGARRLDLLQQHSEHGPSVEAHHLGAPIRVDDLRHTAAKWPLFTAEALAEGFQSVYAFPLRLREHAVGVLTLFGRDTTTLPPEELYEARALTDIAAIGIVHEREIRECRRLTAQLQTALSTRVVIEQAKGLLSQASQLSVDEAFELLRGYCRREQQKISTIATMLVRNALSPEEILGYSAQP
ncbi:GAF and ANTAR domain-containing protein [Amycolatopsis benzoatilytica]|uniref:GAF and ANTAR domain-containing protein n=1 Tax=Amycolatopsis benzoatilytica TaxID=346045 RepID=UPI000688909B|nr:GAF and ANTAR domain-containing protein [Amycolatopsis benzoatilytica]